MERLLTFLTFAQWPGLFDKTLDIFIFQENSNPAKKKIIIGSFMWNLTIRWFFFINFEVPTDIHIYQLKSLKKKKNLNKMTFRGFEWVGVDLLCSFFKNLFYRELDDSPVFVGRERALTFIAQVNNNSRRAGCARQKLGWMTRLRIRRLNNKI